MSTPSEDQPYDEQAALLRVEEAGGYEHLHRSVHHSSSCRRGTIMLLVFGLAVCGFFGGKALEVKTKQVNASPGYAIRTWMMVMGNVGNGSLNNINSSFTGGTNTSQTFNIAQNGMVGVGVKQMKPCEGSGNHGNNNTCVGPVAAVCCMSFGGQVQCEDSHSGVRAPATMKQLALLKMERCAGVLPSR